MGGNAPTVLKLREVIDRIRTMADAGQRAQVTLLAAAIAFFSLLSVVPLGVVAVAVAATIGGGDIIDPLLSAFDHLITDEADEIVRTGLEADGGRSGATLLGLALTMWGSLRVFRALDRAFNTIYGEPGTASILDNARNAVSVVLGLFGMLMVVGVVLVGINLAGIIVPLAAVPFLTMPLLALVLLPMYAVFPPGPVRLREAIPGAIVAGIGITLATGGLQLYFEIASPFAVYGVLAGVFVAMLWFYVIAIVLLIGAIVNATEIGTHRQLHVDGAS